MSKRKFSDRLNDVFLLLTLALVSIVLTVSLVLQFYFKEMPCPLCLLQRLAFFGIAFGLILALRLEHKMRYIGYSMLFAFYLVVVGARQSLINIIARPHHTWIGGTIFGLHLPVWSVIIGMFFLLLFILYFIFMPQRLMVVKHDTFTNRVSNVLSEFIILLGIISLVAVIVQCGASICHTNWTLAIFNG